MKNEPNNPTFIEINYNRIKIMRILIKEMKYSCQFYRMMKYAI